MPNAISIHIGVDAPGAACPCVQTPLNTCEDAARNMAELATKKGFEVIPPLIGTEATPQRVLGALEAAVTKLAEEGDILLVTFSGHGCQVNALTGDEALDEAWCLSGGILVDDELLPFWRRLKTGGRIVLISESCYSGGIAMAPKLEKGLDRLRTLSKEEVVSRTPTACAPNRRRPGEFDASLLLLASSREEQTSPEGYFTKALLEVVEKWEQNGVELTYCQLWQEIRDVVTPVTGKTPHIRLLGTERRGFASDAAFKI